ncbi:MAG: hypothetical protein ACC683_11475, partial [Acidimicrobiia bacterium]
RRRVAASLDDKVEAITRQIADLQVMRGDLMALATRAEKLTERPRPKGSICHILEFARGDGVGPSSTSPVSVPNHWR